MDICGFTVGNVFDISQTTLEKKPILAKKLTTNHEYIQKILDSLIESDKAIEYDERLVESQVNGYYNSKHNIIRIRADMASSYSFGYVASYSNRKLKSLIDSLEHIKNTSQAILGWVTSIMDLQTKM